MKVLDAIYWLVPKPAMLLLAAACLGLWLAFKFMGRPIKKLFSIAAVVGLIYFSFNMFVEYGVDRAVLSKEYNLSLNFIEFFSAVAFFLIAGAILQGWLANNFVDWVSKQSNNPGLGKVLAENGLLLLVLLWGTVRVLIGLFGG